MGGGSSSENSQPITGINVTPLVDIVLVLLIIFMATAPLIQKRALKINVPKSAHSETRATESLQIQFTSDRRVVIDNSSLTVEQLDAELKNRLRFDPDLHVALSADEAIPYGEVVGILDVVRGAGVKKVALDVKQKKIS